MDAHRILVRSFAVLSEPQKENLRWHLDQGTPLCCGRSAWKFVDASRRAAAPEVLANVRELDTWLRMNGTLHLHIPRSWEDTFIVLLIASGQGRKASYVDGPLFPYEKAIESEEAVVRKALREAVK